MAAEVTGGRLVTRRNPLGDAAERARKLGRAARKKPMGAAGAIVLIVLVLLAVFADVIAPYSPLEHSSERLAGPSSAHWAGTDQFGRDVLSRVIHGARTSLYVGVAATILSMIPAVLLGMTSAFFGGWFDYALQRFVDTIQALPALILLVTILVILGPGLWNVVFALSFNRAIVGSRVMRGATLSISGSTYVEAARACGASNLRIILGHLLPNIVPTIIVVYSLGFGTVILAEASLSFLGYG
ncbi:MAG: ABC transporter permease, partial [Dehalococcoidia bacterium]|nr:ABC transporter permease [Dehalococcoidia bacterium]